MKKHSIWLAAYVLMGLAGNAQNVAINSDGSLPDAHAALDIKSADKGLLIPRMSSAIRQAIPNTKGLLVYDTTTSSFWYNTGAAWQSLSSDATVQGSAWLLTGNSGTDSTHYIGTSDSTTLHIKVNGKSSGIIDPRFSNSFWGYQAGSSINPGPDSLFNGAITGDGNTAFGAYALNKSTTARENTAIGDYSLFANTTGNVNVAAGSYSLQHNTTGGSNIAIGYYSMSENTIGSTNTTVGFDAMASNTVGMNNVAYGPYALSTNTTGNSNTAIGYGAGVSAGNLTNATAIGNLAIADASNKVRIGNSVVTVIEGQVPFTTPSDGRFKYAVQEDVKGLDFVLKLRPVTYRFDVSRFDAQHGNPQEAKGITNTNYALQAAYADASLIRRSGFIAQEVEKAAKASGYDFSGIIAPKTEQEHYSLSYESFVVPLVKAVQEQQKTIDAQNKTIAGLQQQLDEIKQLLQHTK